MVAAAILTAIATTLTALGGLVLALAVLVPTLRAARRAETAVAEVHTMVNQQRTDAARYTAVLVDALRSAGVNVPNDQSLTEGAGPN